MTDVAKPPLGMTQNQYAFAMTVAYLGLNLGLNFFNKQVLGQHVDATVHISALLHLLPSDGVSDLRECDFLDMADDEYAKL